MSDIEWTDATVNCFVGCSLKSKGCENCYAQRFVHRGMSVQHHGLTVLNSRGPRWTGEVRFVESQLVKPLRWKKPRKIFWNSLSDSFHEAIPIEQIAEQWAVMLLTPHHTHQVLTKRAERMHAVLTDERFYGLVLDAADRIRADRAEGAMVGISDPTKFPAKWIWLGVSTENQAAADERIPLLLQTPAAVRFVSAEPLLGPINFRHVSGPGFLGRDSLVVDDPGNHSWPAERHLDLVIVGGESGPGSRPCSVSWFRSIVKQCREAGTAAFVKQMGANCFYEAGEAIGGVGPLPMRLIDRKGGNMAEWPEDLRVRQSPEARQ